MYISIHNMMLIKLSSRLIYVQRTIERDFFYFDSYLLSKYMDILLLNIYTFKMNSK